MKHPSARALHAYWDRLRKGRAAPERAEIDPAEIGRLLGDIFLLENSDNPRHAVRLAGTRLCALIGHELRGRSFGAFFAAEDRATLFGLLEAVADGQTPAVASLVGETDDNRTVDLEMVLLPLRHRGRTHARMLGSIVPLDVPYWTGTAPLARLRIKTLRMIYAAEREEGDFTGLRVAGSSRLRVVQGGLS
ncbi:MAG: PAS domain-containing protein [Rhizobiales bacterium]|nr:PAS domain-containing protein [Hyphomicrobiales bacterium]